MKIIPNQNTTLIKKIIPNQNTTLIKKIIPESKLFFTFIKD